MPRKVSEKKEKLHEYKPSFEYWILDGRGNSMLLALQLRKPSESLCSKWVWSNHPHSIMKMPNLSRCNDLQQQTIIESFPTSEPSESSRPFMLASMKTNKNKHVRPMFEVDPKVDPSFFEASESDKYEVDSWHGCLLWWALKRRKPQDKPWQIKNVNSEAASSAVSSVTWSASGVLLRSLAGSQKHSRICKQKLVKIVF